MKVVLLAGGLGTRLSEESKFKPKPMVEIGGKPIIWHIMKHFSYYGHKDFIICVGYKGEEIKKYFAEYFLSNSDVTYNFLDNNYKVHKPPNEDWRVTVVDTGLETQTGGRLRKVKQFLSDKFFFTYGDGLSDINLDKLLDFHNSHKKEATLSAVYPPGRFGALNISENVVTSFQEKPLGDNSRINGGFFVLSKKCIDIIDNDQTIWEREPLERLSKDKNLMAYKHDGFWQCMDTLNDKNYLNKLWSQNNAPWLLWEND